MTDICACHTLDQTRPHQPCGLNPLMCLNANLLIRADDTHPVCLQLWSLLIQLTIGLDIYIKMLGVLGTVMIEPRP